MKFAITVFAIASLVEAVVVTKNSQHHKSSDVVPLPTITSTTTEQPNLYQAPKTTASVMQAVPRGKQRMTGHKARREETYSSPFQAKRYTLNPKSRWSVVNRDELKYTPT